MRIRSHDQGFVAAPPTDVYRTVADLGRYPSWWDAVHVDPGDPATIALEPRVTAPVRRRQEREGTGLFLELGPPYDGTLEWYLEPFEDGTIVNCLLDIELAGSRRRVRLRLWRLRARVRAGLVGIKRALE